MRFLTGALSLLLAFAMTARAQDFSFEAFVGSWEGYSSSQSVPDWNRTMTLVVEPNGIYTDSSGLLMPPLYPDTQQCEYDVETNRVHFWYLDLVYAGMHFYQHFYYEVVEYTGNRLEMHYNFWDDEEPHPDVQTLVLNRVGSTGVDDGAIAAAGRLGSYPNPFNPKTTLSFSLERAGRVQLKIYDAGGREQATLVDGELSAGHHEIIWKADGLPSGVYLARLRSESGDQTRRLTLLQ